MREQTYISVFYAHVEISFWGRGEFCLEVLYTYIRWKVGGFYKHFVLCFQQYNVQAQEGFGGEEVLVFGGEASPPPPPAD